MTAGTTGHRRHGSRSLERRQQIVLVHVRTCTLGDRQGGGLIHLDRTKPSGGHISVHNAVPQGRRGDRHASSGEELGADSDLRRRADVDQHRAALPEQSLAEVVSRPYQAPGRGRERRKAGCAGQHVSRGQGLASGLRRHRRDRNWQRQRQGPP